MDLQGLLRYPMWIVIIGSLLSLSLGEYLGMSLFIFFLIDEINDNPLQILFSSLFLLFKKKLCCIFVVLAIERCVRFQTCHHFCVEIIISFISYNL